MTIRSDMGMDGYYIKDRLQEIWQQINHLHLSYLQIEESPQKLEQRNKLEESIKEFLCLTPHNQKFIFRETADVLHRSASTKKDFSGYKAAVGWNAIGTYAVNLFTQPWRKEYREIKLYSGFYKHEVETNLVGAEIMFEAMGYKHDGESVLVFEGPVCPDQLISVSQDCLVAYVECQILKAIWEELSANFKISWLEVLEFRETHLCSPKQSVQALTYRFHEKQFQHTRSYSQGTDPFALPARYSTSLHGSTSTLPVNHSFPPLHSHSAMPAPVHPQCIYSNNGYYPANFSTYSPMLVSQYYHHPYSMSMSYPQHVIKSSCHNSGYCCPSSYPIQQQLPGYSAIPTAQLIEVEGHSPSYDVPDGPHARPNRPHQQDCFPPKTDKELGKETATTDSADTWDYVYRNLESQGYSKDLGERGDVLSQPLDAKKSRPTVKEARKVKPNVDEAMKGLNISARTPKISEALQKYKEHDEPLVNKIVDSDRLFSDNHSSYDNVSNQETKRPALKTTVNGLCKAKNPPPQESAAKPAEDNSNTWECTHCTFLNGLGCEICEMCGKSKTKVQDTMEIGGSQCPKCTLVNKKDSKICEACSYSLKNSPTYI